MSEELTIIVEAQSYHRRGLVGWAAQLQWGDRFHIVRGTAEFVGGDETAGRLLGIEAACSIVKRRLPRISFRSTDEWLGKSVIFFIPTWRKSNWISKSGNPIKYQEVWLRAERAIHSRCEGAGFSTISPMHPAMVNLKDIAIEQLEKARLGSNGLGRRKDSAGDKKRN